MFQLNDKVVYPGHGVAIVEGFMEKNVAGKALKFFKLKFLYKDMTVLVPVSEGNGIGIRPLKSDVEMKTILKELSKKPTKEFDSTDFTPSGWNKRNKEYQLKIQGGSLFDLVCIYRDIMHLTKYKELSFGERNLLQLAEDLIIQEILIVQHKKRPDVVKDLRSKFQDISFPGGIGAQSSSSALI